jgi:hypothetical protein
MDGPEDANSAIGSGWREVRLEEPSAEYGYTKIMLMGVSGRVGAVRKSQSAWRQKEKILQIDHRSSMIIRSLSACTGRFTFGV